MLGRRLFEMQVARIELTGLRQASPIPDDKLAVSKIYHAGGRSCFMLRLIDAMDMPSVSPNCARLMGTRQEFPLANPEARAR